ncbi:MAG: GIY-YIG nuclease family protein, partial [Anaerovoracaceae bacterium]|nr:GIY-YIG nuclease family protein [Anaerovoracaceae bacterium]
MFRIDRYDFDINASAKVSELTHDKISVGLNWPVVYVINNDKEAYIGETVNASRRIDQHLQNEERQKLTEIRIISDGNFNKSVILDLESFLI